MKPEVMDRLVTGLSQYLNAKANGTSKFAIADGYLAVDNYFSAILIDIGVEPTRNHKRKLSLVWQHFGNAFTENSISKSEVEDFYNRWQEVRYSSTVLDSISTIKYLRISAQILRIVSNELAVKYGLSKEVFEDQIYVDLLGSRWSSFDEECAQIHDKWQSDAENDAEAGFGSKLGNKALNPSNFCDILVMADDLVTKDILSADPEIGSAIANFYDSFLKLIELIEISRQDKGVDDNEIPNFALSMKIAYHGQSIAEISKIWKNMIVQIVKDHIPKK